MTSSLPPVIEPQTSRDFSASSLARIGLFVYSILIVYASLYPFSGWQHIGLAPWAFLSAPLPYYWTGFDVATNVAAYLPFGLLAVIALRPQVRGAAALLIAITLGALLTGSMEALQTFLPSRISSNLDLICNLSGATLGAFLGPLCARLVFRHNRIASLRQRWFINDASSGIVIALLWTLAQIYPQQYLFGHGQITATLSEWLSNWLLTPIDLTDLVRQGEQLTVDQYWLAETVITACAMTGAGLTLLLLLRRHAPRLLLVSAFIASALLIKAFASALLFTPQNAFVWLTPGARGGILIGTLMLTGLSATPAVIQYRLAVVMLLASLVTINIIPVNPYFIATMQTWVQGKFLNFNGATQFLSLIWPFLALWYLVRTQAQRKARKASGTGL